MNVLNVVNVLDLVNVVDIVYVVSMVVMNVVLKESHFCVKHNTEQIPTSITLQYLCADKDEISLTRAIAQTGFLCVYGYNSCYTSSAD